MIVSDLLDLPIQVGDELKAPSDEKTLYHCMGCFGCWIKTPGRCVVKDSYMNMGKELGKCDELVLVSKCTYGGFSPFVKNVLDRFIPYISPKYRIANNEMHHKRRYDNTIKVSVFFYSANISTKEKDIVHDLVYALALNLFLEVSEIRFLSTITEVKEALA